MQKRRDGRDGRLSFTEYAVLAAVFCAAAIAGMNLLAQLLR